MEDFAIVDAQGRGRAGDMDPADQWVFNPQTGSYELRLPSQGHGGQSDAAREAAPRPRGARAESHGVQAPEGGGRAARRRAREDAGPAAGQRARRAGTAAAAAEAGTRAGRRKAAKPKRSAKRKILMWGGGSLAFLTITACTGGYLYLQHLNDNITKVDIGKDGPVTTAGKPMNILIVGTDTREGKGNTGYGDKGSVGHADTNLLFHVSADRSNATVMSIPRDLITDIPDCEVTEKDGSKKIIPGQQNVRFNTSLGQEGRTPACTVKTAEKITGLSINHFLMADFNAVKDLSTAVGGVPVCLKHAVHDSKSHLNLPAGHSVVKGEQALAFVRTRHSIGFGSDLSRIQMQQEFLSSLLRKLKSNDTLGNPSKLLDLAEVATKSLTVDKGIGSVNKLVTLAKDLRQVNPKTITFLTVPVLDNPQDSATVILDKAKAGPLFKMVQADKSLSKTDKSKKKSAKKKPVHKAPASEVRVDVLNGGGPVGAAQGTVTWMQNNEGMRLSTNAGNAPQPVDKTTLEYAPNQADQAATLADLMGLPDSALKKTSQDAGPKQPMTLTLGPDFTKAGDPIKAPDKAPAGIQNVNAGDEQCMS
jgi:LCP family protein required for cell wall assembly